ncbi:MAG: PD-(D/E)XK nuclease family protein [Candidatus Diapherotrites archaeon]|nr:PD-(D/E)XK nuclease family protein [Candidatus Diapherotrites archaeon]
MECRLSPTTLALFLECERCFWLHFVKGIKRPDFVFPSLQSGMDKIIKEHFDRYIDKGVLPPEIRKNALCDGFKLFSDKEKLREWRNSRRGLQYIDNSGIVLAGAIDSILEHNGKLIVLDFKTRGSAPKEDSASYYELQLDIYNLLLRKNGYETEDYGYLLFYYPKEIKETGEIVFESDLVKVMTNPERGAEVFKRALALLCLKEPPEPNKNCGFCNWAKKWL